MQNAGAYSRSKQKHLSSLNTRQQNEDFVSYTETDQTTSEENNRYNSEEPKLHNSMKIKFRKIKSTTDRNLAYRNSMKTHEVDQTLLAYNLKLAPKVKGNSRTTRLV